MKENEAKPHLVHFVVPYKRFVMVQYYIFITNLTASFLAGIAAIVPRVVRDANHCRLDLCYVLIDIRQHFVVVWLIFILQLLKLCFLVDAEFTRAELCTSYQVCLSNYISFRHEISV